MSKSALLRDEVQAAQADHTLRDRLRQATRSEHDALESGLDLMRADFGLPEYQDLLVQYHGFYASFESFLQEQARQGSAPAMFYCAARRKSEWLAADLESLNLQHRVHEARVPFSSLQGLFPSASHQLGAIYVLEGSMLGARVLSRHFSGSLGLAPECGLRYFSGYGSMSASMWNGMLQLLAEEVPQPASSESVIDGAKNMFALLSRQFGVMTVR